ncbi:MAG: type II secretion system protein [Phycisphaerae bacterium]
MASTYMINRQNRSMRASRASVLRAFTLIELMVAVAIIAVLISILVPAFSAVHTNAKKVATKATIGVLDRGLESFRGEQALGGVYPPSQSDRDAYGFVMASNPFLPPGVSVVPVSGANLLVYAMTGADRLGTAGFRDIDGDGLWDNDQHNDSTTTPPGAYALDPDTAEPLHPRYPGAGSTYVDEPTAKSIRTAREMEDTGEILSNVSGTTAVERSADQPFFTDKWGRPILYYRANRAASSMVGDVSSDEIGVYNVQNNRLFTGVTISGSTPSWKGIDFGAGKADSVHGLNSRMGATNFGRGSGAYPERDNLGLNVILGTGFANTFQQFIYNPDVTQRNEPVNRNTYLLISAGADAVYGSSDDVVNWTRDE